MSLLVGAESLIAVGFVGRAAIHVLEVLFAAGIVGSAIVVVITFIEDLAEVFAKDDAPATGTNVVQGVPAGVRTHR